MDPDSKEQIILDGVNEYNFTDLAEAEYTVKFTPDPVTYPEGLPTYLGDVLTLAEADFVLVNSDLNDKNIHMISKPEEGTGDGKINGNVQEDDGDQRTSVIIDGSAKVSDVLGDVFVYLINSTTDNPVGFDITDGAGYFEFKNLDEGSYHFIADYKGIPMDSENPVLEINQENDSINIVSTVYTEKIAVEILVTTGLWDSNILKDIIVYPNPTDGVVYIEVTDRFVDMGANGIYIYDLKGQLIKQFTLPNPWKNVARINIGQLPDGLYIFTITGEKKHYSTQLLIEK
jgi:hypothetical protein